MSDPHPDSPPGDDPHPDSPPDVTDQKAHQTNEGRALEETFPASDPVSAKHIN